MMIFPMPESSISISLKYRGRDVEEATMPIEEVILALQGFSGAYGKIASSLLPDTAHELRVAAVKEGSFDLSIIAWVTTAQGKETLHALSETYSAAKFVFGVFKDYIDTKKHLKDKPFSIKVEGSHNTIFAFNGDGFGKEITPQILDLLKTKLIEKDVAKIVSPLEAGRIEDTIIEATDGTETLKTQVDSDEKAYFGLESKEENKQEVTLSGRLVSNNKDTLKGTFSMANGRNVPYHYVGKNPELFQSVYAFSGNVRVHCIAYSDESLEVKRVDITEAIQMQGNLDFIPKALQAPR